MLLPSLNAELTLDPKGRVMLPRLLRSALESQSVSQLVAFANGGPSRGLALYRVDDFQKMQAQHQQKLVAEKHEVEAEEEEEEEESGVCSLLACQVAGSGRPFFLYSRGNG